MPSATKRIAASPSGRPPASFSFGAQLIDVDEQARERLVVALGALELLGESRAQVPVVVEAGHLVVHAEPLELRALEVHLVVQPLDAQHRRDAGEELLLRPNGFAHVVVGADAQALDAARRVGAHGHEDHGQEPVCRDALQQATRLEAAEARHDDVEQHEVHAAGADALDRLLAVLDEVHRVPGAAQDRGERLAREPIVVGDDDARGVELRGVGRRAARPIADGHEASVSSAPAGRKRRYFE